MSCNFLSDRDCFRDFDRVRGIVDRDRFKDRDRVGGIVDRDRFRHCFSRKNCCENFHFCRSCPTSWR